MSFIDDIKLRAKKEIKTIVLPEAEDLRTLKAVDIIAKDEFCKIVLVGNKNDTLKLAEENDLDISKAEIIDPNESEDYNEFANTLYELRKHKGMTEEEAKELMKTPVFYGMMMIKLGKADGLVSGACHSTADTLRPALQILKTAPGTKLVSSFCVLDVPNCEFGENGVLVFSDCGLNQKPNEEELSEIAISTAKSYKQIIGKEPRVAMLSYSTFGSAKAEEVDKVRNATNLVKEKEPEIMVDGEMQFDAAVVPSVAKLKAPESKVAGKANTFIFPDLQAGNIGYKLVERLAKAEAYGPICQGMAKPVNDLSRGCKAEDIVGVIAITCVQSQNE